MRILGFEISKTRKPAQKVLWRSWDLARVDRLMQDWFAPQTDASGDIRGKIRTMRGRARELERNDPYMSAFLEAVEDNIIGPDGFTLQMKSVNPDGTLDMAANALIERHWREWNKRENFLTTGDLNGACALRLACRTCARDGEVLIRFVRGYARSAYSFAIQLIEADHIDEDYNIVNTDGTRIDQGVELDQWGRMVAIHILTRHPGDSSGGSTRNVRERIPAEDLCFVHLPKRIGETRSAPWVCPSSTPLRMLTKYEEAEIVAARAAAGKMAFAVQTGDNAAAPEYTGDAVAADPKGSAGKYMDAAPGTIEMLPKGLEIKPFDPQHPTAQFAEFRKGILRGIATGLGVSYHRLANDLSDANYSSLREGKLTEQDHWKKLQNWWAENVMIPIFTEWLKWSLAMGKLTYENGNALPFRLYAKFNAPVFRGRRWAWVDPLKDMQAQQLSRAEGWTSDSEIIESTGGDIEDVYRQIESDSALANQFGVVKTQTKANAQNEQQDEKKPSDGRKVNT